MTRAARARTGVGLALAGALLVSCGAASSPPAPPTSVLFLMVDSLRADRLGCYGAERPTSPRLDQLAATGARFERAYVPAPWTQPSVASLFTGLEPSSHGLTEHGRMLPLKLETLAERLQSMGYRTAAVVSNKLLSERYQFDQGFEGFDAVHAQGHTYVSTGGVTEVALGYLDRFAGDATPFFLFVHYFDPHYRYLDHADIDFAPPSAGRLNGERGMWALRDLLDSMTPEEVAFLEARYDEEIRFTDQGIGQLLDRLDGLGLSERTLVVFTADHGEEFLAHGWLGHTRTLYEELVRAPLLLRGPGIPAGRVVGELAPLVSLPGTLLELAGAGTDAPPFAGGSFADLLRGESSGVPWVFCEVDFVDSKRTVKEVHKRAIVALRWKAIRDLDSGALELYDLEADPDERRDLADEHPDVLEHLLGELDRHGRRLAEGPAFRSTTRLSEDELQELIKLGYAGETDDH